MADSANAHAGQWMPVARIDDSPYEVEGFVKLLVEIEGDVGKGALFLYKWRSANAIESGETDKGQKAAKVKTPTKNFDPMTGKRVKQKYVTSNFDAIKMVSGIVLTVLVVWITPIYDWMFYAVSILQMAFIFHFVYKLMRRYNLLTTRRLPQFNRTGGDDSAKEAHKAGLD